MDHIALDKIWQMLLGSAGTLAALVYAVKWLDSERAKLADQLSNERNAADLQLSNERDARMRVMEESNRQCAEDRTALRKVVDELQQEIRALLKEARSIKA